MIDFMNKEGPLSDIVGNIQADLHLIKSKTFEIDHSMDAKIDKNRYPWYTSDIRKLIDDADQQINRLIMAIAKIVNKGD